MVAESQAMTGKKLYALTFDDGPDTEKSSKILDRLEIHGVPASFFVVGSRISDESRPILQRARSLSCEIENHGWSYDPMDGMSREEIVRSVSACSDAIQKAVGEEPCFFRPPNLALSPTMLDTIAYPMVGGIAAMDWQGCHTTARQRADKILSQICDGAILLLHDVQPDPHPTPQALDLLLPALERLGYRCVSLRTLFSLRGGIPSPGERKLWVNVPPLCLSHKRADPPGWNG
ncbi:polysaccharide deacetylase family protein [Sediminispirochaeta bajacaliforniensis]|uniref:polysaccharide deacetylase family protein n=1 Tax=Sediminispirochaeta bajacaliforniensis TaxID=148 RepID=UPI0003A9FF26|nr:polysaccharide deacetylase family protein [Sediminispirochaeta bajacaliforniensis]